MSDAPASGPYPGPAFPDELTLTLRKPVEFAGETYRQLVLREPTAAEWMLWDKLSGVEADTMAVSTVAGMPLPAARMIGARDLVTASRFLANFLA